MVEGQQNKSDSERIQELAKKVEELEAENQRLRQSVTWSDSSLGSQPSIVENSIDPINSNGLSNIHIERYSRQLLLHGGFGVQGQAKLLSSSVLIVGAGGIGSTVILYLAACGVGHLTVVDFDEVEVSNLHRQVIHKAKDVGMNKADSACKAVHDLNPTIQCEVAKVALSASNALDLVSKHDCIVDASDNPLTRYLINDACVLAGKPLVSGSAIGFEGQLTVYNYNGGPCYRCLYPKPNISEGAKSCSDNGVLGTVPGLIGILQAVEVVKVLTGVGEVMSDKLAMYDAMQCSFLRIKKPRKQPRCPVCGPSATITSMEDSENATGAARGPSCSLSYPLPYVSLPSSQQISPEDYQSLRLRGDEHVLLDVRVPEQFDICGLDGAINIPLSELPERLKRVEELSGGTKPVFCLRRRGIASASATQILNEAIAAYPKIHSAVDIKGGLDAWRSKVDRLFPKY